MCKSYLVTQTKCWSAVLTNCTLIHDNETKCKTPKFKCASPEPKNAVQLFK